MNCKHCGRDAVYKCSGCGNLVCGLHTKLRSLCPSCIEKNKLELTICKVEGRGEKREIRELVKRFWGEEEQLTFDRKFTVTELPTFAAKREDSIIGFICFAELEDAIIIVVLGVLPAFQGMGVGRDLMEKAECEAKRMSKKRLLVSTSNDDLPALAFYQSLGFQIFEVKPDAVAEKHGEVLYGTGGLPVRDELRLRRTLH